MRTCANNGADCIQLRTKGLTDSSLLKLARAFSALCKDGGVISIINDRVDIAILAEADGVHLGQDEIGVFDARHLAKRPLIVGVSTHCLDELERAIDSDCDYVGIGPAFTSPTKPDLQVTGPDYLSQALPILDQAGLLYVAIGGITSQNIPSLLKIGIRAVAISSAITDSENPAKSCKSLKNAILKSIESSY